MTAPFVKLRVTRVDAAPRQNPSVLLRVPRDASALDVLRALKTDGQVRLRARACLVNCLLTRARRRRCSATGPRRASCPWT